MSFDRKWFEKHQAALCAFANSFLGRWFFRFDRVGLSKDARIMEVGPNHVSYDWRVLLATGQVEKQTMLFRAPRLQRRFLYVYAQAKRFIGAGLTAKLMQPQGAFGFLPLIALTTSTFYPDPNVESTSVDGEVTHAYSLGSGQSWATLVAAAGSGKDDSYETATLCNIEADNVSTKWRVLTRSIFLFDTAAIPNTDTISAATFSVKGTNKYDDGSFAPDINVYASAPASNTAIANGDFDSFGSTAFSTAIPYASFSTSAYNDFALNASGLAAIDNAGVTKLGFRNANYDVAGSPPTWGSSKSAYMQGYTADRTGTSEDPKLVVTHAAPPVTKTVTDTATTTTAVPKSLNRSLLNTLTTTTAMARALTRKLLDTTTVTTILTTLRQVSKTVTDTITTTTSRIVGLTRSLLNTLTTTTATPKELSRTISGGTVTTTTAAPKSLTRTLLDAVTTSTLIRAVLNGAYTIWSAAAKSAATWAAGSKNSATWTNDEKSDIV